MDDVKKLALAALLMSSRDEASIPHADQIETLRAAAPRFARLNPFKVGDLVTPAQGTTQRWHDTPHLVIETRDGGFDPRAGEPGSDAFALVPDLRVLVMTDRKTVAAFWVRSEDFESYVAPATPPSSDI